MENEDKNTTELLQSDWLEIESASSTNDEAGWYENENSVVIKECFFSTPDPAVFPSINHEDLPIDSLNQKELQIEAQSQASLNGEVGEGKVEDEDGVTWTRMDGLGFLSSAIGKIVSGMTKGAVFRASLWRFASAATGVGALLLVVVLVRRAKRWRQRKLPPESQHHLMLLLKSKDQKISELLLQVSQLNDMLLARRRVPVLQVG